MFNLERDAVETTHIFKGYSLQGKSVHSTFLLLHVHLLQLSLLKNTEPF